MDLRPVVAWKTLVGERIVLGAAHQFGKLVVAGLKRLDQLGPALFRRLERVLIEGGPKRRRDDRTVLLADAGQRVAHEMDAAALDGGRDRNFGGGYCNLRSGNSFALVPRAPAGARPGKGVPLWYSMELQNHPWRDANGQQQKDTAVEAVLEHLIEHGPSDIATVFGRAFELAMQIERERFLRAGPYERTAERQGYANGYKSKRIDTPAGTVTVDVPKTAGHDGAPFYPQSLERGRRSVRAVMLAVAEMYIKGVSTREVEAVMREFGIESLSSSQVSRAAKLLDDELEAWRSRPLGEIRYLILDARYEKMRHGGIVRDAAVLSAVGIGPDERRRVLGVSVALSEAEVHWRAFLEGLQARGLRGVEYGVSDDHAGLRAARRAVLGGAKWQRCQFHLARNAPPRAELLAIRKRIERRARRSGTPPW